MRRLLWLVVGLGLLALGVYLLITLDGSVDFGWYAYEPGKTDRALGGDVTVLSQTQLAGAGIAVAGLLVLAAEIGFRAGRRQQA